MSLYIDFIWNSDIIKHAHVLALVLTKIIIPVGYIVLS